MGKLIDETGNRYGRLFVIERTENVGKEAAWSCLCDCGEQVNVIGRNLRTHHTRSCGCLNREAAAARCRTHGLSNTPEYSAWGHMIQRCTNPNSPNFPQYGGRGIKICEIWLSSFEAFYHDMGKRPSDRHSLDRIDNDSDYTPDNTHWATWSQQSRNRRSNAWLTYNAKTLCITDWADELDLACSTLRSRLLLGWSVERTLTEPAREKEARQ